MNLHTTFCKRDDTVILSGLPFGKGRYDRIKMGERGIFPKNVSGKTFRFFRLFIRSTCNTLFNTFSGFLLFREEHEFISARIRPD